VPGMYRGFDWVGAGFFGHWTGICLGVRGCDTCDRFRGGASGVQGIVLEQAV
jgi:hypothetical protein